MEIVANSGDINALFTEAVTAHGAGRLQEAYALYQKVLTLEPSNLEALKRISVLMLQGGQAAGAFETIKKARELRPKSKSVMEIFGAAAMAAGEFGLGVRAFENLSKVKPVNPLYFAEWSRAEYELNNYRRAIARYLDFLKYTPAPKPENHFVLGRLYFRNRQPLEAAKWLDKAMAAGFENSEILAIRANCYIHEGDEAKALQFFERAIKLDPDNVEAHYQHRNLIKTEAGDPIFAHLEGLKDNPKITGTPEVNLYFMLGKMYQRLGEDDRAFDNYQIANQKTEAIYAGQGTSYDPKKVAGEFEVLKNTFSKTTLAGLDNQGSDSEMPVFIVGMPRSGTTLLEQIITAHPLAEGRGELDAMHYIHVELEEGLRAGKTLESLLKENGKAWQKSYLDALAPSKGITRVSDKLPANFRSLGLISLLFPKAKIIHIHRNPFAVGFSIFGNLFDTGHPYSTSLKNIGDYTRQTLDLIEYWKAELDLPILELAYEDLVADQEAKSKEVIKFLGLDWDPACLEFHKQDTAAMTLSSIQVRKPMTSKSVDRWKRFEKHLGLLEEGLGKRAKGA